MIHTFQTFLASRAAMLGYPPEEAYRLLNPLAWALRLIRCLRYSAQHLYGHWFGHSRVILRDVNDYGDSITLVRSLSGKAFVVRCEICFIMEITHRTVSQHMRSGSTPHCVTKFGDWRRTTATTARMRMPWILFW
jgi:hypothetical protein